MGPGNLGCNSSVNPWCKESPHGRRKVYPRGGPRARQDSGLAEVGCVKLSIVLESPGRFDSRWHPEPQSVGGLGNSCPFSLCLLAAVGDGESCYQWRRWAPSCQVSHSPRAVPVELRFRSTAGSRRLKETLAHPTRFRRATGCVGAVIIRRKAKARVYAS
jgi:hypothetical protein